MDESVDRRRVFLRLTERERFEALFDALAFQNQQRALLEKKVSGIEFEVDYLKTEIAGIGRRREGVATTQDKISFELARRFEFWKPVLQRTIGDVLAVVVLTLLYLSFGGKLP